MPPPAFDTNFDIDSVAYTSSPPTSPKPEFFHQFFDTTSIPMMPLGSLPMMPMNPLSSSSPAAEDRNSTATATPTGTSSAAGTAATTTTSGNTLSASTSSLSLITGVVAQISSPPTPQHEGKKAPLFDVGHVKFISREMLIEAIVSDNFIDKNFNETFVLTHNLYMTDSDVMKAICDQAFAPPEPGRESDVSRRHLRIVLFLKTWVEKLWHPSTDSKLVEEVRALLVKLRPTCPGSAVDTVEKLINRRISGEDTKSLYEFNHPPPRLIVPTSVWQGKPFPPVSLLTFHPIELARQMTLLEQGLFRAIRPWEFQNLAFSKKDKNLAPNISAMTQFFNKASRWLAWDILGCQDLTQRIYMLESAVELAHQFRLLQNFNAVNEVISALNSSAIHRLHATWDGLSPKGKNHFKELSDLMATAKNYQALRNEIQNLEPPCVPYLGLYLTDLTFLEEGNPTLKDNAVNWQKCARQAEIIVKIQTYQSQPYCLKPIPVILEFLKTLNPDMDENSIWAQSLVVEPREKAKDPAAAAATAEASPGGSEHSQSVDLTYDGAVPETFFSAADLAAAKVKIFVSPPGLKKGVELAVPGTIKGSDLKELTFSVLKKKGSIKKDVVLTSLTLVVAPTRERPVGMIVQDSVLLQDLAAEYDVKKDPLILALCAEVYTVEAQYLSAFNQSSTFQILLDASSTLYGNELFIKNALSFTKEDGYAILEIDLVTAKMKWLNSNFSLKDQGFSTATSNQRKLVIVPMSRLMRSETEAVAKVRTAMWNRNVNTRCGFLMHVKERGLFRPGIPPRTMIPQNQGSKLPRAVGVFEKKRLWHAAVDNFLLAYSDSSSGTPEGLLILDQYRVSLGTLVNGQLCVILLLHANSSLQARSKPLIYVGNNDISTRQWYDSLVSKSLLNVRTAVFGKSIEELVRRPGCNSLIPQFILHTCQALVNRALDNCTLFSTPVNSQLLYKMRAAIDSGKFPKLKDSNDDSALAQLLVSFLAEMPDGLIPNEMLPEVWKFSFGGKNTDESTIKGLNVIMKHLPPCNAATLRYLIEFFTLWKSVSNCHDDPAEFLGPIILRPPEEGTSAVYLPKLVVNVSITFIQDLMTNLDHIDICGCSEGDFESFIKEHPVEEIQPPYVPLTLFHASERTLILDAIAAARPLSAFEGSTGSKRQAAANMISQLITTGSTSSKQNTNSPGSSNASPMSPRGTSMAVPSAAAVGGGSTTVQPSNPSPPRSSTLTSSPQSKSSILSMDLSIEGEISFFRKPDKRRSPTEVPPFVRQDKTKPDKRRSPTEVPPFIMHEKSYSCVDIPPSSSSSSSSSSKRK